ncbi:MAG: inositol monophosphatase family protein [Dermatophilaceae bacterium]
MPFLDERYAADLGRGATLNRQPIHVGDIGSLDRAVISVGDFATGTGAADKNVDRLAVLDQLAGQALRVRMLGSAATDFAWLARGRTDAVLMLSNHPWDVAAGVAIAREAGAKITDIGGHPYSLSATSAIAAAPTVHVALIQMLTLRKSATATPHT